MNVDDTIERCENRLSFLSNKISESAKTIQAVKLSSENTKKSLQSQMQQLKDSFERLLNKNYESICATIDDTVQKDLAYLQEIEASLQKDVGKVKTLIEKAKDLKVENDPSLTHINKSLSEIGKGSVESPIVSLSFSCKVNEAAVASVEEKACELLKLNMTGAVQIIECLERPGAIIVRWDERQCSDSESITTDASTLTEFILQYSEENNSDGECVYNTLYEGDDMQFTMKFAEPNKIYTFRVCHYYTSASGGGGACGAWSMTRKAFTTLSPHVWRQDDCTTDNDLTLYQLSNRDRTATKVFPESSRILRSRDASYLLGQQLTFYIEETGESSLNDAIGFISQDKQILKHLTQSEHAAILNTKGTIYINGLPMVTKFPSIKRNSVIIFHASRQSEGKLRISISIDDKEVTFDWSTSTNEKDALYFACGFEHTGWQLSVG